MKPLKDLPNQQNFRFTGICNDDSKIDCVVLWDKNAAIYCAFRVEYVNGISGCPMEAPIVTRCLNILKGWEDA